MQHAIDNTTVYMVQLRNYQKVNEACNGSLISRGFQENGMKLVHPLHVTGFYALQYDGKKEAYIPGEEMLCSILYLKNSDKARLAELKKRVKNVL